MKRIGFDKKLANYVGLCLRAVDSGDRQMIETLGELMGADRDLDIHGGQRSLVEDMVCLAEKAKREKEIGDGK